MNPKISDEMRRALGQSAGSIERALQVQEDCSAIQAGIVAMNAGNVLTIDELDARIRSQLASVRHSAHRELQAGEIELP